MAAKPTKQNERIIIVLDAHKLSELAVPTQWTNEMQLH